MKFKTVCTHHYGCCIASSLLRSKRSNTCNARYCKVQANQTNAKRVNRNDLTYRISSTATPEQNRALRSKASK